jgi:biopolymer transport protein ExbD
MAISLAMASDGEPMSQMNTTPLIDVMLVLLIVFIITLPLMTHAVKLEIQGTPGTLATTPVDVAIEYDGTVLWNGEVVNGFNELEARFKAAKTSLPPVEVRVRAERRAAYDTVAKVLAAAQRNGIQRLGIQGND